MNLTTQLIEKLGATPERIALRVLDSAGETAAVHTYGELFTRAGGWAAKMRMDGVIPGDRIALATGRDLDLAAAHLAALASGVSIVPVNTALSSDELGRLLAASQPKIVMASSAYAASRVEVARAADIEWWLTDHADLPAGRPFVDASNLSPATLSASPTAGSAIALRLFTSGTTGAPKSVPLSHDNLRSNLDALAKIWGRTEHDRLLHLLPAHHFHGLVLALYGSLYHRNEIVLAQGFDARVALDAVERHSINLLMGVPTMYARMLAAARDGDNLDGVRLAISGSAPLSSTTYEQFEARFGIRLVERYGLTETCILTSNSPSAPKAGSAGRPLPGTALALRSEDGTLTTFGAAGRDPAARGEICAKADSITAGYENNEDANAEAFQDGWFRTGDLGRIDDDGTVWIDGRAKDLIIVGGSNVVPGEVERALESVTGVVELAVAGAPDPDLGEIVVAYVVAGSGAREELEKALAAAAEEGLAKYKRPRRYEFMEALPRNAMGKVDRAKLG